jgi:ketosteroid isomerase-like protein
MDSSTRSSSQVLDQLVAATNAHDLDELVDCFAPDYVLTDPIHPARSFTGVAQVRKNWGTFFAAVPDLRLEEQARAAAEDGFWLEARQAGTRQDGAPLDAQMVFIAAVSRGRITSARIYVAPVEQGGPDVDAVVGAVTGAAVSRAGARPREGAS